MLNKTRIRNYIEAKRQYLELITEYSAYEISGENMDFLNKLEGEIKDKRDEMNAIATFFIESFIL